MDPRGVAAHSCQRGFRRPRLGSPGKARDLHAPNSSTNRKWKQKPKLHPAAASSYGWSGNTLGRPPRDPRSPSSTPRTSHLWASLSKPRAGRPPRPSTLRLRVAQLSGPPACASLEHRSARLPSQPLQRPRARTGWTLPLDEEARPHKLGAPLCRHPATRATRVQGASCLRFDRAQTPKLTPRVATANRRMN